MIIHLEVTGHGFVFIHPLPKWITLNSIANMSLFNSYLHRTIPNSYWIVFIDLIHVFLHVYTCIKIDIQLDRYYYSIYYLWMQRQERLQNQKEKTNKIETCAFGRRVNFDCFPSSNSLKRMAQRHPVESDNQNDDTKFPSPQIPKSIMNEQSACSQTVRIVEKTKTKRRDSWQWEGECVTIWKEADEG